MFVAFSTSSLALLYHKGITNKQDHLYWQEGLKIFFHKLGKLLVNIHTMLF